MEGGAVAFSNPRTVKDVFKDFKNRRAGILKALTNDVETFTRICDPEKENLCLYGLPNGSWEVNLPAEEVPSELPEPALGINFARDGMQRKDWLSLVAVHSDAWLFAVAFYYGARFDKNEREHLFNMMNDLPTLFDIVTGRKLVKEKASANSGNKTKSTVKVLKFRLLKWLNPLLQKKSHSRRKMTRMRMRMRTKSMVILFVEVVVANIQLMGFG
ncbi:hypothetical protein O6H91_03G014500 [Diphasiastrum complanatum]|uniref:Uncharacterized protein n=1 Tax=Diphasiastrum complanatum TaxID=34168 RepID=A0ACC2E3L7_DIPCM|nr:hypothetical protein O6H91_03G014500 [Diphasiastrum complanatum]